MTLAAFFRGRYERHLPALGRSSPLAPIATSGHAIPPDLPTRAGAVITAPQHEWAKLSLDMRDATLTGTATTQSMIDEVVAKVAAVHGVRAVTSNVILAEYVS